ncbi:MAG: glycoside hydrolase family 3 N-terminal domain-containing protein, partial [Eubacteriales bacterium]|nr:glycoside hydrolase family 3 N-terminal domain-containing protein [Eubacteriales bacterium]
ATMEAKLDKMSLEEKVGQMILAYHPAQDDVAAQKKYQFGGYIFFAKYFNDNTPEGVVADMASFQEVSKIGMLLAVDEEGGTVNRISRFPMYRDERFASPQEIFHGGGWDGIVADAKEKAAFLKILGLNTNLAPVVDVPYDKENYIYNRAFSTNPEEVADFAEYVTTEFKNAKVVSCLKHYPGYGNMGDTHRTVIEDTREQQVLDTRDSMPFQAGIAAGTPMIMVSHTIVDAYDAKNPASLSKAVHNVLRSTLGFDGVIITDDLEMSGVTKFVADPGKVAIQAVQAGNDMIISGKPVAQYEALLKAVKEGTISEERINESVLRILNMKKDYGLIEQKK